MRLRAALAVGGVIGGLAIYNRWLIGRGGDLTHRLGGETRYYRWRGGDLAYDVAGEGEALLLVHGVYAGASSLEFRNNFEGLSRSFRVYSLDLLGCGMSERPRRRYGPEDVTSQIEDFTREEIGGSAHLVASSLSAALIVPAAVRSPRLFKKLVLICPTGYGTLDHPVLGQPVNQLSRRRRRDLKFLGELAHRARPTRQREQNLDVPRRNLDDHRYPVVRDLPQLNQTRPLHEPHQSR